ncbi:hypothetical protein CQA53_11710, partial [Helicobacter didelphidarum]
GYDIWSNIHYGYIGKAVGFSEIELLSGAGVAQDGCPSITSFCDDPKDSEAIKLGFEIYDNYKENIQSLSINILMQYIIKYKAKLNIKVVE